MKKLLILILLMPLPAFAAGGISAPRVSVPVVRAPSVPSVRPSVPSVPRPTVPAVRAPVAPSAPVATPKPSIVPLPVPLPIPSTGIHPLDEFITGTAKHATKKKSGWMTTYHITHGICQGDRDTVECATDGRERYGDYENYVNP